MNSTIEFVEYDETFLHLSYEWLTDPEIKRLTMTPTIDKETQIQWFNELKGRNDYFIRGISCDKRPIGAVGLKHIGNKTGEYWGYIGDKNYIGCGIGKKMVHEMCNYAKYIGLESLYLYVADYNERAYRLYLHCGFTEISSSNGVKKMQMILL